MSPLFVAVVSAAAVAAAHAAAAVAAEVAAAGAAAAFDFHVAAVKVWRCLAMHFIKNFFVSYFSSSLLLLRFFVAFVSLFIYKIFSFMFVRVFVADIAYSLISFVVAWHVGRACCMPRSHS